MQHLLGIYSLKQDIMVSPRKIRMVAPDRKSEIKGRFEEFVSKEEQTPNSSYPSSNKTLTQSVSFSLSSLISTKNGKPF
jgi:hypothetical protein